MCHRSSGVWGRRVTVPEASLAEMDFFISFIARGLLKWVAVVVYGMM